MSHYLILSLFVLLGFAGSAQAYYYHPANQSFEQGVVFKIRGEKYYIGGANSVPDGANGEYDLPGHTWVKTGRRTIVGRHVNTGPFGSPQFYASGVADGELLFIVEGKVDRWTEVKAAKYYSKGFVRYEPLRRVSDGAEHPNMVIWLKHVAVSTFTFDLIPVFPIQMTPGVTYEIFPNWFTPYVPQ